MENNEQNLATDDQKQHPKKQPGNHMDLGMCLGMMAGSVGMSILSSYGKTALGGLCIPMGMFIGMVIGMLVPTKE